MESGGLGRRRGGYRPSPDTPPGSLAVGHHRWSRHRRKRCVDDPVDHRTPLRAPAVPRVSLVPPPGSQTMAHRVVHPFSLCDEVGWMGRLPSGAGSGCDPGRGDGRSRNTLRPRGIRLRFFDFEPGSTGLGRPDGCCRSGLPSVAGAVVFLDGSGRDGPGTVRVCRICTKGGDCPDGTAAGARGLHLVCLAAR